MLARLEALDRPTGVPTKIHGRVIVAKQLIEHAQLFGACQAVLVDGSVGTVLAPRAAVGCRRPPDQGRQGRRDYRDEGSWASTPGTLQSSTTDASIARQRPRACQAVEPVPTQLADHAGKAGPSRSDVQIDRGQVGRASLR